MPNILLLGGHGKIAQLMTPLLLKHSWNVTSVIRDEAQTQTIKSLAPSPASGKLDVLVSSVEDVQTNAAAKKILDETKPDWIVWSAGAGGKGGADRTKAVDEIAAKRFIHAAYHSQTVTKFLLISYTGSRRNKPSWWSDDMWKEYLHVNAEVLPDYAKAKIAADEYFTSAFLAAKDGKREGGKPFAAIDLRPGSLTDDAAGNVQLGKTDGRGKISRATVAEVAAALLASDYKGGWVDLLEGKEDVQGAVDRVASEQWDCVQGEDLEKIKPLFEQ